MTMRAVLFLLSLLIVAPPVLAQVSDAAVNIEADTQEVDLNGRTVTYFGNVVASQGDLRLRADNMRAELNETRNIDRIIAAGRVVVNSSSGTITGDAGTFEMLERLITVTGKVVLVKDRTVLRGAALTYNLNTRQAKFTGSGRRVQGLFTPPPRASQ